MSASPGHADAVDADDRAARSFRPARGSGRAKKWLLRALAVLVGVALLYLLAINAFLRTPLLRKVINGKPNTIYVEYAQGWSFWPGTVHGTDLRIRGRDENVEWLLSVDRVEFHVSLLELFHQRFHATRVTGEGVSLLLRSRQPPDALTPERMAAIPRIPGFDVMPVAPAVKEPPPTDESYDLWTVHLENVVADPVREIWVDVGRFTGDARVTGGFYLKPIRWASVGPATMDVRRGDAWTGSDPLVRDLVGRIDCTVHGFDPRQLQGAAVFRAFTADAKLDGHLPDLSFLESTQQKVDVQGGGGTVHVDAAIDGGLLSRADVAIDAHDARIAAMDHVARGSGRATLRTVGDDVLAEAALAPVDLARAGEKRPLAHVRGAKIAARGRDRSLEHLFAHAALSVDLEQADLPDLHLFDAYLGKEGSLHLESGRGTLRGHLDGTTSTAKGEAVLSIARAAVKTSSTTVRGDATITAKLVRASAPGGEIDLSGSRIDLADLRIDGQDQDPWSGRLDLGTARVRLLPKPDVRAALSASCRDARPILALLAAHTSLPSWAADLVSMKGVAAEAQIDAREGHAEVRNLRAKVNQRFELAGDWSKDGDRTHTLLLVTSGPLGVGVESQGDDTHVALLDARGWFLRTEPTFR